MFEAVNKGFQWFTGLGSNGILCVALLIIGLVLGLKVGDAVRSALTATVGFIGLNLTVDMLIAQMSPATMSMVERMNWNLDIVDVGWGLMGMAWGQPGSGMVIIALIATNIALIFLNFTKTLMVDFWNYWSFAASAALIYGATGNMVFTVLAACIYMAVSLKWADKMAPTYQEFYGIPGCTWPTGAIIAPAMIGIPVVKLIQKIPGIKNVKADPETMQEKMGIFGEPIVIGAILGMLIGFIAGYDVRQIMLLGFNMAAVMILLPRMIQIMMEGLISISDQAKIFTAKYMKGREVWIGIDASTIMGNPATMSAILIMTPIVTFMSIIPGNRMLATASLVAVPWFIIGITAFAKENILHICMSVFVVFAIYFWCATAMAGAHTHIAEIVGFEFPEGTNLISSLSEGGNPITFIMYKILDLLGFVSY
ncbi:PTS galactitol transporter subunit IIC [Enterococcus florum]|uniref:PTS galactitol transporter subunit IIC n=1 Tax=Enterococcus florum TaxID=2480627 RepID=A0A4P5P3T9_9ENTE|nr:PTS transporter subunit IIC [Enterococcus florum]GCF92425.1 PTS galactitol transporter subunit IIC [Enterococcus florum]